MSELTGIAPKPQVQTLDVNHQGLWLSWKKVVIVGGIGAGIYLVYYYLTKNRKRRVPHVENFEPGKLNILQ
jgi:hypothetical protein